MADAGLFRHLSPEHLLGPSEAQLRSTFHDVRLLKNLTALVKVNRLFYSIQKYALYTDYNFVSSVRQQKFAFLRKLYYNYVTMQLQDSNFFAEVLRNRVIWASFFSWGAAQGIKIFSGVIKKKRFDFKWLMSTGGMPSAHSAGVSALATAVGCYSGFGSIVFAITAVFALIIMFDAQGLRRRTGMQAEALNRLMEDIYFKHELKQERLIELIGHTPVEVFVGAILGIVVAVFVVTV